MDWRTHTDDAGQPVYVDACLKHFDAISPWTVGAYSNTEEANNFAKVEIAGDLETINKHNEKSGNDGKVAYIPVVFPGRSAYNSSGWKSTLDEIPRKHGSFLWTQVFNVKRYTEVSTIFGATWDG